MSETVSSTASVRPLRILVTGSRFATFEQHGQKITEALQVASREEGVTLVHGAAQGVDRICARIGAGWGWTIEPHPAQWTTHGKAAGPLRNMEMVDLGADVLLAFPVLHEANKGTLHCTDYARRKGMRIYEFWLEEIAK